eukprot:GHVR01174005.1.p1 GENE.GHVR01174005.1~~GHVR01174005.1.p1  ORF type:complete len:238 (+),score=59.77 GHVR01174005.1:401-1114(+)
MSMCLRQVLLYMQQDVIDSIISDIINLIPYINDFTHASTHIDRAASHLASRVFLRSKTLTDSLNTSIMSATSFAYASIDAIEEYSIQQEKRAAVALLSPQREVSPSSQTRKDGHTGKDGHKKVPVSLKGGGKRKRGGGVGTQGVGGVNKIALLAAASHTVESITPLLSSLSSRRHEFLSGIRQLYYVAEVLGMGINSVNHSNVITLLIRLDYNGYITRNNNYYYDNNTNINTHINTQ